MNRSYLRLIFILIWIGWILFSFINLVYYNDDNPIKLKYGGLLDTRYKVVFPEGWAFFTKSPRDDYIQLYQWKNNKFEEYPYQRQADLNNWVGLKRNARSIGVEFAYLVGKIPQGENQWLGCDAGVLDSCVNDSNFRTFEITNNTKDPLISGRIFAVKRKVIPWAWSSNYKKVKLPIEIISLNVSCPK